MKYIVFVCAFLPAIFAASTKQNVVKILSVTNAGPWGDWGNWDNCPEGSFANGFRLKVESEVTANDQTAVNSICLECVYYETGLLANRPCSAEGQYGDFRGPFLCPNLPDGNRTYVVGFALKNQAPKPIGDDSSVNNMKAICQNLQGTSSIQAVEGVGNSEGVYTAFSESCNPGSVVCGLQTRVEPDRGNIIDDTTLNDVQMACCTL